MQAAIIAHMTQQRRPHEVPATGRNGPGAAPGRARPQCLNGVRPRAGISCGARTPSPPTTAGLNGPATGRNQRLIRPSRTSHTPPCLYGVRHGYGNRRRVVGGSSARDVASMGSGHGGRNQPAGSGAGNPAGPLNGVRPRGPESVAVAERTVPAMASPQWSPATGARNQWCGPPRCPGGSTPAPQWGPATGARNQGTRRCALAGPSIPLNGVGHGGRNQNPNSRASPRSASSPQWGLATGAGIRCLPWSWPELPLPSMGSATGAGIRRRAGR